MAVYKRSYKHYPGPFTPVWSRFLVLPRYAFQRVFSSRWMLAFYVLCFIPVLVFGAVIYLRHNVNFLDVFGLRISDFLEVDGDFFAAFLGVQYTSSFVVAAIIGPGLVSPDLVNNALPLYLCRPFSRTEYVLGKLTVLVLLMSSLTWIPGLALILMHTGYSGLDWFFAHPRYSIGMVVAPMLWILVVSLLSLALSAWVRWRMIAGALLFVVLIVLAGFGGITNEILRTKWGSLINIGELIGILTRYLLIGEHFRGDVPIWSAVLALGVLCCFSLLLLNRRLQAYEVVRS